MKDLAKKLGLKASQVYKWNWDQQKKQKEDLKIKKRYYPNLIFQVLDAQGNDITKPVFQKFRIYSAKSQQ